MSLKKMRKARKWGLGTIAPKIARDRPKTDWGRVAARLGWDLDNIPLSGGVPIPELDWPVVRGGLVLGLQRLVATMLRAQQTANRMHRMTAHV